MIEVTVRISPSSLGQYDSFKASVAVELLRPNYNSNTSNCNPYNGWLFFHIPLEGVTCEKSCRQTKITVSMTTLCSLPVTLSSGVPASTQSLT